MKFITDLKLNQKIVLLVLAPLLIMIAFGLYQSYQAFKLRSSSAQLAAMVEFNVDASHLVHELQKERGLSAGYIGSNGDKFAGELVKQYQKTDESLKVLNKFLDHFDADSINHEFDENIQHSLSVLADLESKRIDIKELNLTLPEAIKFYSDNTYTFLHLIEQMSTLAPDQKLAIHILAYANYLQSKERAGMERAILTNVFSKDTFTDDQFKEFVALTAAQEVYLDEFLSLTTEETRKYYHSSLSGRFINEAQRMHDVALKKHETGSFSIAPAYWFEMQTGKIELLKEIEDHLAEDLAHEAEVLEASSTSSLILILLLSLAGLLTSIFLGVIIGKNLLEQIGGEPSDIESIAKQIADGSLQTDKRTGTATGVYGAILSMQNKLSLVIESDIQSIVDSARQGDLSKKINLDDKSGFYKTLGEGVNDLVQSSESITNDTVRIFSSLAKGDLTQKITGNYHGSFNQLKEDANSTVDKLKEVIEGDITAMVNSALAGDLNNRIDLNGKHGFFKEMSTGINRLIDSINDVFEDASTTMNSMAHGDLTNAIENEYSGQFDVLKNNINASMFNLEKTITGLRESSDVVSSTSREIAEGNNNLSARTEHQASALEQTAASMEEITSTVKNNADHTSQAEELASSAKSTAIEGGDIMQQASTAMEEINQSSQKIAEIISVIDEIAFQTNLLALNASVEAARAGEQGRGFAVVATEVRNLAGRSATAAKEIKELINDSVGKVESGVSLVEQSSKSQVEIIESITRVGSIISEISSASQEQSEGIEQVNAAVTSMDEVTQQNAALAEQTSAAATALNEQAGEMSQMMNFFTVNGSSKATSITAGTTTPKSAPSKPKSRSEAKNNAVNDQSRGNEEVKPKSKTKNKPKVKENPEPVQSASLDDEDWEEF